MIGIVIASHATLAGGLREAAEMIAGPQERLVTVALSRAENLDEYRDKLEAAAAEVNEGQGVLILVDLFGGSPGNTAAYLQGCSMEVVGGASLPMLLEVLMSRSWMTLAELAAIAIQAGRDGTVRYKDVMLGG